MFCLSGLCAVCPVCLVWGVICHVCRVASHSLASLFFLRVLLVCYAYMYVFPCMRVCENVSNKVVNKKRVVCQAKNCLSSIQCYICCIYSVHVYSLST